MGRLTPLTRERMTPEQAAVADAILSGPRGAAPRPDGSLGGPFDPMLRSAGLADIAQQLGAFCRYGTSLSPQLSELAIIMTGKRWHAQIEFHGHARLAREAGLPDAVIEAIRVGAPPPMETDEQRVVYAVVTEFFATSQVSDATYAQALALFGERGIAEICGIVGYYTLVAMLLNTFDVDFPAGVTPPLP